MPQIENVEISGPPGVQRRDSVGQNINVTISFSDTELSLNLKYHLHVFLYEVDDGRDFYAPMVNGSKMLLTRSNRGDRDDHIGTKSITSFSVSNNTEEKSVAIDVQAEAAGTMKLQAIAFCVPETGTAAKWSATKDLTVVQ